MCREGGEAGREGAGGGKRGASARGGGRGGAAAAAEQEQPANGSVRDCARGPVRHGRAGAIMQGSVGSSGEEGRKGTGRLKLNGRGFLIGAACTVHGARRYVLLCCCVRAAGDLAGASLLAFAFLFSGRGLHDGSRGSPRVLLRCNGDGWTDLMCTARNVH